MSSQAGFCPRRLARLSRAMAAHVADGTIAGAVFLLARRGEVHAETIGVQDLATGTPMRRDTMFRIASVTKPIMAAAAMALVEEGLIRLDQPVDCRLPELADRRVLRMMDGPLEDTVPAERALTLRDLLTFRCGIGATMSPPGSTPLQRAMAELEVAPGPDAFPHSAEEFMGRIGRLPLAHQPGMRWMYHTGFDILGVLVARAAGQPLAEVLRTRLLEPLGMRDTGFHAAAEQLDRLATCYRADQAGNLVIADPARGGKWSRPPAFASGSTGLVSTADDLLAFGRMMLAQGRAGATRILARPTLEAMVTDQITPAQKSVSPFFPGFWDQTGWGLGLGVITRRDGIAASPGRFGWNGGYGTSWWCDPREDLVGVLLTQRLWDEKWMGVYEDFWTLTYQAIDD